MFPPLPIASFYAIATMNGYKEISNSLYYSSLGVTALATLLRGIAMESTLPPKIKLGGSLLGATIGTGLTAFMGHNTGRAIREITSSLPSPSSLPSSLHNGALYSVHPSPHLRASSHLEDSAPMR
jgi:hypothetical protein